MRMEILRLWLARRGFTAVSETVAGEKLLCRSWLFVRKEQRNQKLVEEVQVRSEKILTGSASARLSEPPRFNLLVMN